MARTPAPPDERLRELFEAHFDFIWRFLRRLGVEAASVDDAAQRVFLTVADKLELIEEGKSRSFLVGCAIRVASNARRAQTRNRESTDTELLERAQAQAPDPEQLLHAKQRREVLDDLLEQLNFEQRSVFVLNQIEGLSREEIATLLELPAGTVASRLRLAKQHFMRLVSRLNAQMNRPSLEVQNNV